MAARDLYFDPAQGQHFIVTTPGEFTQLVGEGKLPFFANGGQTAVRPVDADTLTPTGGWALVDGLPPTFELVKQSKPSEPKSGELVYYDDGIVSIAKKATAEDVLEFARQNPALLAETIAAEKAGKGRVTLIAALTDFAN